MSQAAHSVCSARVWPGAPGECMAAWYVGTFTVGQAASCYSIHDRPGRRETLVAGFAELTQPRVSRHVGPAP